MLLVARLLASSGAKAGDPIALLECKIMSKPAQRTLVMFGSMGVVLVARVPFLPASCTALPTSLFSTTVPTTCGRGRGEGEGLDQGHGHGRGRRRGGVKVKVR
jgi:hypothetical protein